MELNKVWVLFYHVIDHTLDTFTHWANLCIQGLLLAALLFKHHDLVDLVKFTLDRLCCYHVCHKLFGFQGRHSKECAQLLKGDVHVDLADHSDVVLDQSFIKHFVAIPSHDVLVLFKLAFKVLHILLTDYMAHSHFF